MTPYTLSIIIVTYNSGSILIDCLRSIPTGIESESYEIIIVDNASSDGTPEQISREFPEIRLIVNKDNRGFAGGNNQGLAAADGRYLLLLNPDVVVAPSSLSTLVQYLEKHPHVGIVGPKTCDGKGKLSLTAHSPYTVGSILWEYLSIGRFFPTSTLIEKKVRGTAEPFEAAWVQGSCLMMRREVFQEVGGLDEGFFLFAEEPDLCERALKAGWKTCFVPTAEIIHYESTTVSRYPERRIRNYHISPLHYFRKRHQETRVWLLKLGFTLELGLKMIVREMQALTRHKSALSPTVYLKILAEIWRY